MTVYRRERRHSFFKWALAGTLFVLILAVSWTDVYGLSVPSGTSFRTTNSGSNQGSFFVAQPARPPMLFEHFDAPCPPDDDNGDQDDDSPEGVPEPTTILLLAGGLAATRFVLRRRS